MKRCSRDVVEKLTPRPFRMDYVHAAHWIFYGIFKNARDRDEGPDNRWKSKQNIWFPRCCVAGVRDER